MRGGEIVAVGTPEMVVKEPRSYTGHYLAPLLTTTEQKKKPAREIEAAQ